MRMDSLKALLFVAVILYPLDCCYALNIVLQSDLETLQGIVCIGAS